MGRIRQYRLNETINFGRHKGKTIRHLIDNHLGYVTWLLENTTKFDLTPKADDYFNDVRADQ